jgi:hypothetical protein
VPFHSTNPRFAAQKSASGFQDRAERLRKGRAAAQLLREVAPTATHIAVRLQFLADEAPSHADQSFVLYPGARAYFGFPCPYGDCDGIYDLTQAAESTLQHSAVQATGTLECSGVRSRHRMARQPCGLHVSYTVTAEHRPQVSPRNSDLSQFT